MKARSLEAGNKISGYFAVSVHVDTTFATEISEVNAGQTKRLGRTPSDHPGNIVVCL